MDEVKWTDHQAMELAITEARRGAGLVSPNPQVGCVILGADGRLLSKGFHQKFGGPHAEVEALKGLTTAELRGARLFVTLEPCAHEGKTPSCAKAIAKLPVSEVIYGLTDPNPLVAGQGAAIISAAGISCQEYQGSLKAELEQVCEHFLMNMRLKRPFFSLKVASSLDGQLALKSGESKWITGVEARRHAHYLRATHEVTLIGQGTLLQDNPSLDVRHPDFPGKKNKVFVLMGADYGRHDLRDFNICRAHRPEDIYFLARTKEGYLRLELGGDGHLFSPAQPLTFDKNLRSMDSDRSWTPTSVLVEGGAQILSSFIEENRGDRLYLFQAPILLGAKGSKAWTEGLIIKSMNEKIIIDHLQIQRLGLDLLITGRLTAK